MCRGFDVKFIVMLCDIIEDNKEKCLKYWDIKGLRKYEMGKRKETTALEEDLFLRKLTLRNIKEKEYRGKDIDQVQFIGWDDHEGLNPIRLW